MPSSFSRFLSDDELMRVRQLYLESLEDDEESADTVDDALRAPSTAAPGTD